MEVYNINPIFISLLNQDSQLTNEVVKKKKENFWKKAILSSTVVIFILAAAGVPVYGVLIAMEGNALPLEFTEMGVAIYTIAHHGDLYLYEFEHFGMKPSKAQLTSSILGALNGFELSVLAWAVPLIADLILASGAISVGSITDIILVSIAGVSLGPVTLAAIGALSGWILGE